MNWQTAKKQARRIGQAKTEAGKRRSVRTWCRHVREALRG